MKRWFVIFGFVFCSHFAFGVGSCPTGSQYINPSNPTGALVTAASLGCTGAWYVSTSGADTNAGTTEGAPFLHAPGMPNCANSCAAASPSSTVWMILRGGDTWHRTSGTVLMGGQWTVGAWGYVGIDVAWFAGGSFARPIISMDNALSTSTVSSCSAADDGAATPLTAVSLAGRSNLTFDGFEFTGACSSGAGNGNYLNSGTAIVGERLYFHGWTLTATAGDDSFANIDGTGGSGNRYLFIVMDGADSTYGTTCNTPSCVPTTNLLGATGWAFRDCADVEYSVVRHVSNGLQCVNIHIVHDNFFEYEFEPSFGGGSPPPCGGACRHGNYIEAIGDTAGSTCNIYNNIQRNGNQGVGYWPQCSFLYAFGNNFENLANGGNAFIMSPPGLSNTAVQITVNMANSVADGTSSMYAHGGNGSTPHWASGSTITMQNMHVLDRTAIYTGGSFLFSCNSVSVCSEVDSGGEIFQTTAVANGQGYTLANDFSPTSSSNATVHAGNNLSSSCSTFSSDSALCSGTSKGVTETSAWGGLTAVYPATTINSRGSVWDTGPYQFSGTASTPTFSPVAGTYAGTQNVVISTVSTGAIICYNTSGSPATNGTTGCTTGTLYTGAVAVSSTETLFAVAGGTGFTDSSVGSAAYTITPATANITINGVTTTGGVTISQ